jgi:hypothetical protein
MRTLPVRLGLVTGLVLLTAVAQAQDNPPAKKDNPKERVANAKDYAALAKHKEVTGKVVSIDGTQRLTFKIEKRVKELKDETGKAKTDLEQQFQNQATQMQASAQREYQQIARTRNQFVGQQRMQQFLARQQAQQARLNQQHTIALQNLYKTVTTSVSYELPVKEGAKVARTHPAGKQEDKGEVVIRPGQSAPTKKQDTKLGGYPAAFADVQPGQLVKLSLAKPKAGTKKDATKGGTSTTTAAGAAKGQTDSAASQDVPSEEERPQIRRILILRDASPAPPAGAAPGNGKKQP